MDPLGGAERTTCPHARRRVHDRYGKERRLRWKCVDCGRTFSERRSTLLYRARVTPQRLLDILVLLEEGWSTRRIGEVVGLSQATVIRIVRLASERVDDVSALLVGDFGLDARIARRIARILAARRGARAALQRRAMSRPHATSATASPNPPKRYAATGDPNGHEEDAPREGH